VGVIYLASPYSHPDPKVRQSRFEAACRCAADLMRMGKVVYCAVAHTHPIAVAGKLPNGWSFWKDQDAPFLRLATELYILQLKGWDKSVGIQAERDFMWTAGKPVHFIPGEFYERGPRDPEAGGTGEGQEARPPHD
jgi:hypothetical protein